MQAFAWFSDLIVEHAEIFWSLFAVDMDRILAEQPPDTWDSFPLFQILNDYLRTDGEFLSDFVLLLVKQGFGYVLFQITLRMDVSMHIYVIVLHH